jgi:hypothetical protein
MDLFRAFGLDIPFSDKATAVVGLYGSAKVLLAREIADQYASDSRVVHISFKDFPIVTMHDVYHVFAKALGTKAPKTDFELYHLLVDVVARLDPKKLLILIEEAHVLVGLPESFFDALESLCYRNEPQVSIILFGQPQLRGMENKGLVRLLHGHARTIGTLPFKAMSYIFALEEKRLGIGLQQWKHAMFDISGGHYGAIKYIGQLIKKHKFSGVRLTQAMVKKWSDEEPNLHYFLRIIWDSLTDNERLLVKELLVTGTIALERQKGLSFENLHRLGVVKRKKTGISFILPVYRDAIISMIAHIGNVRSFTTPEDITVFDHEIFIFSANAGSLFTYQERRVLIELVSAKGTIVGYEHIGSSMWGTNSEHFSLWSIAKCIQRIRKKLQSVGISPKRIRNVSGKGYRYVS